MTFREPDVGWLRRARRAARAAAAPARPELNHAEAVELVTAELLANAFTHGAAPVELRVVPGSDGTLVEVRDAAPRRTPCPPAEAWRGMGIVQNLTTRLEVVVGDDGKAVSATVPLDAWAGHRRAGSG